MKFLKKLSALLLIVLITSTPVFAQELIKTRVYTNEKFSLSEVPKTIEFTAIEPIILNDLMQIPKNSIITAEIQQYQKERRWHKSGFFICKLKSYSSEGVKPVDISDTDTYLIARKHEKLNGKDAAITGTELVLATAASVFAPGVDIAYFFTKGAIQRQKHKNWFKAGVSNAYDNSICWFWLKGKSIELDAGDSLNLKEIKKQKAKKLEITIEKRHAKESAKKNKQELKLVQKKKKQELKQAQKTETKALENEMEDKISSCAKTKN